MFAFAGISAAGFYTPRLRASRATVRAQATALDLDVVAATQDFLKTSTG